MFEKINLISLDSTIPLRTNNYTKQLARLNQEFSSEALDAFDSEFTLSGNIRTLIPIPFSPSTRRDTLYLQSFILIDADNRYYTLRKDYESYLLLYTYRGNGTLKYEEKTIELQAGDGFLIDCRKPHEYYTSSDNWYHADLHFDGKNAPYIYQEFEKEGTVKFTISSESDYQKRLEKVLYDYSNASAHREFFVESQLTELLSYVLSEMEAQNTSEIPETIRYLTKYMESNYTSPLSLDQLASFSGMSKYHLSREFKKYIGYSPNDYLILLRLEHAKLLLTHTALPACKIGAIVGIPNEVNFLRLFKKKNGVTPGEYRKNCMRTI